MMDSDQWDFAHAKALLEQFDQQHTLRFWGQLGDSARERLLAQLKGFDLKLVQRLHRCWGKGGQEDWAEIARRSEPPRAIRLKRPTREDIASDWLQIEPHDARSRGQEALQRGNVGVLLVAGGQGSRLGFEKPKSLFAIGPVSGATLLQIHCEKVLATARQYDACVPLYLMTSPATHEETIAFMERNRRFGLAKQDVFVFCQNTMPAVDAQTGKLLLADKDRLSMSPDGHGGTIAALANSGALADAHKRGLEQLFYLQVDNPLAPICDPTWIGYHLLAQSELSSVAVAKEAPLDRVGNFVSVDGRLRVIEYIDFPEDVAAQRAADGSLRFWAGNTAIHVFDVAFLSRVLGLADALPFHIQHKKVPYLNDNGEHVEPREPNALKFERFIFDLLPHSTNVIVIEAEEEKVFAPLKNAPGADRDTPEFVQERMIKLHRQWLQDAGASVAAGVTVEVSPLYALDEEQVRQRMQGQQVRIAVPTYLQRGDSN